MSLELSEVVEDFKGKKILIIGDVMLDHYVDGDVVRISPEAPIPIMKASRSDYVPGGAANVANNIKSLEGEAHLVGLIGDDDAGRLLVKILSAKGIECSSLVKDPSRPTIEKTRYVSRRQQLLRVDHEDTRLAESHVESRLISNALSNLKKADAVILSDYSKGTITKTLARKIIVEARRLNKPVIVDPKPSNSDFYAGASIIKPNMGESIEMAGIRGENNDGTAEQVGKILSKKMSSNILITRGSHGMTLVHKDGSTYHIPGRKVELADVSGAGDTVVACLSLCMAIRLPLKDAAELANKAGGIVVTKFGTAVVSPSELKSALKEDITKFLHESIKVKQEVIENHTDTIESIAHRMIDTYKHGKKILIFGNGGSASDAQHLAGELIGRFKLERKGFPAIALTADTSTLTAIGNDYGFENIFSRQIEALGTKGDLAVAFSTSGNSPNIINGLKKARELGMSTVLFTGKDGGKALKETDLAIVVPSLNTPRIQETHISLVHIICELLESRLKGQ